MIRFFFLMGLSTAIVVASFLFGEVLERKKGQKRAKSMGERKGE